MNKTLTKHGNSLALVIDKPILELLRIDCETPLSVTTDGACLVVAAALNGARRAKFNASKKRVLTEWTGVFKKLAE